MFLTHELIRYFTRRVSLPGVSACSKLTVVVQPNAEEGEPGHYILQHNMPDQCPMTRRRIARPRRRESCRKSSSAFLACLAWPSSRSYGWHSSPVPRCAYPGWLAKLAAEQQICACGRHIDEYGDHVHSCKKYTSSPKADRVPGRRPHARGGEEGMVARARPVDSSPAANLGPPDLCIVDRV